jgi:two-component system, NarL family, nitrate/nitrite response regulator NarL
MNVLLIDDHPLFRQGLRSLLERMEMDFRIEEAESCEGALDLPPEAPAEFDLILLDLALPGMNGLEAIGRFRTRFPTTPVVIISASYEAGQVRQAIDRGAQGFIPKFTPPAVLMSALRLVFSGGVYIPPTAVQAEPAPAAGTPLTTAQSRVLALMARGQSNKVIANALAISDNTVRAHVSAILRALNSANRTEAVRRALEHGLVSDEP